GRPMAFGTTLVKDGRDVFRESDGGLAVGMARALNQEQTSNRQAEGKTKYVDAFHKSSPPPKSKTFVVPPSGGQNVRSPAFRRRVLMIKSNRLKAGLRALLRILYHDAPVESRLKN